MDDTSIPSSYPTVIATQFIALPLPTSDSNSTAYICAPYNVTKSSMYMSEVGGGMIVGLAVVSLIALVLLIPTLWGGRQRSRGTTAFLEHRIMGTENGINLVSLNVDRLLRKSGEEPLTKETMLRDAAEAARTRASGV